MLDEAQRIANADHEIVLRPSIEFEITHRDEKKVAVLVSCSTVLYPFIHNPPQPEDPALIARIRDLEDENGSVILDF